MILAALALACAERIGRGGGDAESGRTHATAIRHGGGARPEHAEPAPLLAYLRGGSLVLDAPARRMGGVPPSRVAPGTDPSHFHSSAARHAARRTAGTRTRRILTLALARRLAAARDGTLSSRSNGVPPPVFA